MNKIIPYSVDTKDDRKISEREKLFFSQIVPEEFRNADLVNCDKIKPHLVNLCHELAFDETRPHSICMFGSYGTGKTHLAFSYIREIFKKWPHTWPKYYSSVDLDGILKNASMHTDGDSYILNELGVCDLLFIDDLGREMRTDRLKRQYFSIFNKRYSKKLPTVITSNFTLDQLGDLIDGSIASRMQTWTHLKLNGPDLRVRF